MLLYVFRLCILFFLCALLHDGSLRAATFEANSDVIGEVQQYKIKKGDNFSAIAHKFDVGIVELLAANPQVNPKKPVAGDSITITSSHVLPDVEHSGIVLNLSELRLFYFADDGSVLTFPVSIGKEGWETPVGETKVVRKRENPVWIPTDSIREENPKLPYKVLPGPDNPLGAFAIDLGWPGYAIHGTNRPYSVGKRVSHGCIRLYPKDISALFKLVQQGDKVTVIDKPFKLGWRDGSLYLEVTPTQLQSDAIMYRQAGAAITSEEIKEAIKAVNADIDWEKAEGVIQSHDGIPTVIGTFIQKEQEGQ
jgi:L,D-transpeptidase ErfK/SrfK